jgi:NAD(P)-dependent dehydrogenase (short-subunit alcohol dehydrogenase family)
MSVAPGYIATERVTTAPRETLDRVVAKIRAGRLGHPDQAAHVVELTPWSRGGARTEQPTTLGPWAQGGRVEKPGPGCCNCVSVSRAGTL